MVMESLQRLDPPRRLGKLTLLARLGEGGMATVYVAAMGRGPLARLAAVKLLRTDVAGHDYRTRFLDEARTVVRLHHNNLVDVREAGEVGDQLYIAMELIEGRDLADVWDRCAEVGRAFPVPLAVHMVREVLRGLHYAHSFVGLSLVHRDVSPSNLLIDWAGAVRLADFGLATSALKASHTVPGMVFGKVGYMAPEQAVRGQLDGRADLYGCGVILWELLTGRPLREAGVDTGAIASFEAPPPSRHSRRVDGELDAIIVRALAKKPEDRFETAADFMNALSEWLAQHAPDTNQESVAAFMEQLFGDARERDHRVYSGLMERAGRVGTLAFDRSGDDAGQRPQLELREGEEIPAGYVVADRYRISYALGQGGMGTVYLAEHLTVGRKVAVKVLTHEWSGHDVVAKRFREEARAASAAGHPNIVEVFDAGELPDGRLYIVMEHLTGRSLYEEVLDNGPMQVARACRIVRDVARATKAAHGVGIIHRDLKPDNVMLVSRGDEQVVKVLDFGISASAERSETEARLTRPGHALGTPEYMAPEQAKGRAPTEHVDIYALGVLLYEALTGDPPFTSDNLVEVLTRKATESAPPIDERRAGLPPGLSRLIHECLEIDPKLRPASVGVFVQRLDDVLRSLPRTQPVVEAAAPISPSKRVSVSSSVPAARRRRIVAGVTAGLGALAIGLLWWRAVPADDAKESSEVTSPAHAVSTTPAAVISPAVDESARVEPAHEPESVPVPDVQPTEASAVQPKQADADDTGGEASTDPAQSAAERGDGGGPALDGPVCRRARMAATRAYESHDWNETLERTRARNCFSDQYRDDYVVFRVRALYELQRFDECARLGRRARDRKTREYAKACKLRRKG